MKTDTISDMLTRIRNANLAKHQIVQIPATNVTRSIAVVLLNEGFIESFEELKNGLRSSLLLSLKYTGKERIPLIKKITRASRPGLRLYSNAKKMPRVLGGFGTALVSTSKGLMTDKKAREEGIGGELLCYIW
jgi:small subunit ribosomal protein S8|tara:strand:- start:10347 stop:10745 length:399 start_codon:yes stop_codon:yes gene_type:complete